MNYSITRQKYFKKTTKTIIIFGVIYLCYGCTPLTHCHRDHATAALRNQTKIAKLNHWTVDGVLSFTQLKTRKIARFQWTQRADHYQIDIHSPLGLGNIKITGDARGGKIDGINNNEYMTTTAMEEYLEKLLGCKLPLINFRYWILGTYPPISQNANLPKNSSNYQVKFDNYYHNREKNIFLAMLIEISQKNTLIKIKITKHRFAT